VDVMMLMLVMNNVMKMPGGAHKVIVITADM
jgi:hypothetical protein